MTGPSCTRGAPSPHSTPSSTPCSAWPSSTTLPACSRRVCLTAWSRVTVLTYPLSAREWLCCRCAALDPDHLDSCCSRHGQLLIRSDSREVFFALVWLQATRHNALHPAVAAYRSIISCAAQHAPNSLPHACYSIVRVSHCCRPQMKCYCSAESHCRPGDICVPSRAFPEYKVCKPMNSSDVPGSIVRQVFG